MTLLQEFEELKQQAAQQRRDEYRIDTKYFRIVTPTLNEPDLIFNERSGIWEKKRGRKFGRM